MRPVVAHRRSHGHRVYSYLDDFFGAAASAREDKPASEADTQRAGRDISALFRRIGLWLHPTKCEFLGQRELDVFGILVNTRRAMFLLSPGKLCKLETAARRLLAHAASHRGHVPPRALRSFAGLGNSTNLAVVDARLRLRELFDALAALSSSDALAPVRSAVTAERSGAVGRGKSPSRARVQPSAKDFVRSPGASRKIFGGAAMPPAQNASGQPTAPAAATLAPSNRAYLTPPCATSNGGLVSGPTRT
jgi:hypothetical protein